MEIVACANQQEAMDLLRHCLLDGEVIPGRHFRDELAQEGLCIEDAFFVLKNGRIINPPELDIKTREWKWRVEGTETSGKYLAIVFCFKTRDRTFLITTFSIQRYGGKK